MSYSKREGATVAALAAFWATWCAAQGLPYISADELLDHTLTDAQRRTVAAFILLWDEVLK